MPLNTFLCTHFLHIASIFPSFAHFPDSVVISSYAPLGPFRHVSFSPFFSTFFHCFLVSFGDTFPSFFNSWIPSTLSSHFVLYLLPFVLSLRLSLYLSKPSFPCSVLLYLLSFYIFPSVTLVPSIPPSCMSHSFHSCIIFASFFPCLLLCLPPPFHLSLWFPSMPPPLCTLDSSISVSSSFYSSWFPYIKRKAPVLPHLLLSFLSVSS